MNRDTEAILQILQAEEPEYSAAAALLGTNASAIVSDLVQSDSVEIAAKAASLAGHIGAASAEAPLRLALSHENPQVRVAAAASLRLHPDLAAVLVGEALSDADVGVRKWALRTVQAVKPPGVRASVEARIQIEEHPALRQLAAEVLTELPT